MLWGGCKFLILPKQDGAQGVDSGDGICVVIVEAAINVAYGCAAAG